MNNFETIQEILKKNNIGFFINNVYYDNEEGKYNVISLAAGENNNVTGYSYFHTNLYFNREKGNLEKVDILE